jgi:hypothetical protein
MGQDGPDTGATIIEKRALERSYLPPNQRIISDGYEDDSLSQIEEP